MKSPGPRIRALVLTAGFGTRLHPLTHQLPKPLLPICGEAVAGRTLRSLAAAGCELAVLNLHHLGDAIRARFGDHYGRMKLRYSPEPEILGTLGALAQAREHLASADAIVVINGDAACRWPLARLLRHQLRRRHHQRPAATLLLHRRAAAAAYGGGVGIAKRGRVVQLRDGPAVGEVVKRRVFTGAQVLDPALLTALEPRPMDLVGDLYMPLLAAGRVVSSIATARRWHDIGTPERYRHAVLDAARGRWPSLLWRGAWLSPGAQVAADVELRGVAVEAGATIEVGSRVARSVVLGGATIGAGSDVRDCVIGPGVEIPPSSAIQGRLVTVRNPGARAAADESLIGELLYTPLGRPPSSPPAQP